MAYNRLEHKGGAVLTTLATDIGSSDTALSVTDATNWPTGTNPFYIVIDPGQSNEEKILATARSVLSLTGLTRGVDGTSASAHTAAAVIKHIFTAVEADEANNAAKSTLGTVTTKGDILVATAAQTLDRQGVGALGTVLQADSGQTNGIKWGTIDATSVSSTIAGNGLSISGVALRVNTDNTTVGIAADILQVVSGGIDTTQLAASAVTQTKIADNAVVTAKIGNAQVTPPKVARTPAVRLNRTSDQSIPDGVETALQFGAEDFDYDTMHDGTNPSRITFKTAGRYYVGGTVRFDTNATGYRSIFLRQNSTTGRIGSVTALAPATTFSDLNVATLFEFAVNDYIELFAFHNAGTALLIRTAGAPQVWSPAFWATYVSS